MPRAGVNLRYLSSHRVSNQTEPEDLTLENRCKFSKEAFVTGAGGWLKLNLYLLFATEYFLDPDLQEHSGSLKIDLCIDYGGIAATRAVAQPRAGASPAC